MKLTHLNEKGEARQVDIGSKPVVERKATATGFIRLSPDALESILKGTNVKGSVLTVAKIAGIQGAKKCADLIPLCHSLCLDSVDLMFDLQERGIGVTAEVSATAKTGVEMEALAAVTVASLAIYDMCKAIDKQISFEGIRLLQKVKGESKF